MLRAGMGRPVRRLLGHVPEAASSKGRCTDDLCEGGKPTQRTPRGLHENSAHGGLP